MQRVLNWILTLLKHPTTWIVAIIIVVAVGYYRQSAEIASYRDYSNTLEDKVILTQSNLDTAVKIITANKKASEENQIALTTLEASNKQISEELSNARSKLNSYRNREKVALAKPALVERRVNAATHRVFLELNCATGGAIPCDDGSTKANPTEYSRD